MIPVSRLAITISFNEQGQPVSSVHFANEGKKIFVESGRFAKIEVTVNGKTRIAELPLSPLGWEYDPISDPISVG